MFHEYVYHTQGKIFHSLVWIFDELLVHCQMGFIILLLGQFEPRHEKTGFFLSKNKGIDQLCSSVQ